MRQPVTVIVSPGAKWLSANDRISWHVRAALTAQWREATALLVRAKRATPLTTCEVHVLVHRTNNRRSDATNTAPTIKACVDGAVDAGLLTDDHDGVIARYVIERGPNRGVPSLTITFRPIGAAS